MRGVSRLATVGGDRRRGSGRWSISPSAAIAAAGTAAAVAMTLVVAPSAVADTVSEPATTAGTAADVAQGDPTVLGLNALGVFWLLAGLVALVVGLVLATRRRRTAAEPAGSHRQITSASTSSSRPSADRASISTTPHDPGGARK